MLGGCDPTPESPDNRTREQVFMDAAAKSIQRRFFGKPKLKSLLKKVVDEVTAERKKPDKPKPTLEQAIGEWIRQPELVESTIDRFNELVDERLANETLSPAEAAEARSAIDHARKLIFKKAGKKSLAVFMRETDVDFNELIQQARKVQGEFLTNLTEYLINAPELSDLDHEDVVRVAEAAIEAFEERRAEVLRRKLDQMKGLPAKKSRSPKKQQTIIEKLDKLARLGDLRDTDIQDALAEVFHELVPLKAEDREKLMEMVEKMQEAPDGMPKDRLHQSALDFIQQKAGVTYGEFIKSLWYGTVLSGTGTQAVNVAFTAANVGMEVAFLSIGTWDARAVSKAIRGAAIGFMEGMRDFKPIMKGDLTRRIKSEVTRASNPLELAKDSPTSGKIMKALSNVAYVSRFMSAMDTWNGAIGTRSRLALSAYLRAKSKFPDNDISKIEKEMESILKTSKEQKNAALLQAQGEVDSGWISKEDVPRRTQEILDLMVPPELLEDARNFGIYTTYNFKPNGPLGAVAEALLQVRQKYPIITPLFPFITIPFNVTNTMLNYTPWAFARMFFQKTGGTPGGIFQGAEEMTEADLASLKAKAWVSTAMWVSTITAAWHYLLDEDEKEDPMFAINGGWFGMSRAHKGELYSSGQRPWSIKIGKGSGSISISYKDSPLGLFFGTIGIASDMKRFGDMDEHSIIGNSAAMLAQSFGFITDLNAMAGIADLAEAVTTGDRDMMVMKGTQLFTRPITGFIPNIVKEMESWVDPRVFNAANTPDYILRDIPVVRSHSGLKPMINVLGEEVEIRRTPWRRFIQAKEQDPVWDAIAKRANQNLFIPVARKFIIRGPGGVEERVDDDTFWEYQKAVGERYREWLERNLDLFERLPNQVIEEEIYGDLFTEIREEERTRIKARSR